MKLTTIHLSVIILMVGAFSCSTPPQNLYDLLILQIEPTQARSQAESIRKESAVELADGLDLSLWASDTLINDPVAISIDNDGRVFYVQANRLTNSEFDIRGHRDWMTQSISFQSVEDRRAFIRETFATHNEVSEKFLEDLNKDSIKDWRDLTVEKEEVWFLEDKSGDGVADRAQRYLVDFHEEITDLANGIEVYDGEVFIPVGPDMWRTGDDDADGVADRKESISHGFGVHIGFGAHGMSGAKMGPDGRIWWGIGDIGMNVVDKEGKQWKYPNRGVVVRCDPDGSNFEVFAMGVRNTHEFTFDKYGNLISEDNDGDHRGERERLVYLIDGSDTGWRINWQFGKYTDPDNNTYKVWMDEQMHTPRWDGQAAYFLPCIENYVNGPTGLVYNPGTALSSEWKDHFFVAEFRGTPANSPLHAFTLEPNGAGFALQETKQVAKGLLPTGLDFGPDGALYFSDWIMGWNTNQEGRLWKLDVPGEENALARVETKRLLASNFGESTLEELSTYLAKEDMRVRQKAQFELVKRGKKGYKVLTEVATSPKADQLARIHAIWGIGQLGRKKQEQAEVLVPLLGDRDDEIQAQAAKIIGDVRYWGASDELLQLLKHKSPRVKMFAVEALGRTKDKAGTTPIIEVMIENADRDQWLRHAGMIALGRIGDVDKLTSLCSHPNRSARIAAVVALRRMEDPGVACFLQDEEEYIVAEAARAINDDFSIEEALPQLAVTLKDERFTSEALIRRAINANLRVGTEEN
ncbi:MAG: HEAT repeat domain-containing protein, partial [Bacteroidota bacterium]